MRSGSLILALALALALALTATAGGDDRKIDAGLGRRPCREICYRKASGTGRAHECDKLPSCGNLYKYKDFIRGSAPAPKPIPTSISVTPSTPTPTPAPAKITAPALTAFPWRCRGPWRIQRPCKPPVRACARPDKACFLKTAAAETMTAVETDTAVETITTPACTMPTNTITITTITDKTTTTRRCKPWGISGYDPRSSCGAPEVPKASETAASSSS
ncbi:hypothetical protein CTA2_4169 [Colletotrichum tanaceti]|uniref:Uncharacterized protein n=1 Tax=Colletotrichum tanaceti TaxID=1306861 RepID=A0A4V6DH07_9PEZI|nr:hypothetical protein CTA2_4169 [Colletotrichum tanaceti]TKW54476.1 hypothetical protein CTA1_5024 [Colletotrichum tanaceti]